MRMRESGFIQFPSAAMEGIYKTIKQVGKLKIPTFITGETDVVCGVSARENQIRRSYNEIYS